MSGANGIRLLVGHRTHTTVASCYVMLPFHTPNSPVGRYTTGYGSHIKEVTMVNLSGANGTYVY